MTSRKKPSVPENGTHCVPKSVVPSVPLLPAETYSEIRDILSKARGKAIAAVNFAMVEAYWNIGRIIIEMQGDAARAPYGDKFLDELSRRLTSDFGPGFTPTNLRYMRLFYQAFPIRHALRDELGWTHYRALLRVKNPDAVKWYMNEAADEGWSARALERQISVLYYKCYVLVDLKIGELTYQDIGQMDGYLRLWEEKYRRADDNPTIGLLLCSDRNEAVVKYSVLADNQRLFASKYLLQLPSEEELRAEWTRELANARRTLPPPDSRPC